MKQPFIIPKEEWLEKHDVALTYGQTHIGKYLYILADSNGFALYDRIREYTEYQRRKIIDMMPTVDLVRIGCLPMYRHLGRDRLMEIVSSLTDPYKDSNKQDAEIIDALRNEALHVKNQAEGEEEEKKKAAKAQARTAKIAKKEATAKTQKRKSAQKASSEETQESKD